MFNVTTLDLDNTPKTEKGEIDYSKDFFGKKAKRAFRVNLTLKR